MCLIFDHTKYQTRPHARGIDSVNPNKMDRHQFAEELLLRRILSIRDIKSGVEWEAGCYHNECRSQIGNPGPTVELMKDVLKWYVAFHPSILAQQSLSGHELLYTPQWMQPIELVLARVKNTVAMQSRRDRKYHETAAQTCHALSAMTAKVCQKLFGHSEKLMDRWLSTADAGLCKCGGAWLR
jgi:hypothetical protein